MSIKLRGLELKNWKKTAVKTPKEEGMRLKYP
jgi:hypothetical protein